MKKKIELEKYIQTGSVIQTKHANNIGWDSTVVINVYNGFIEVKQVEGHLIKLLMKGDKIHCRYIEGHTGMMST